MKKIVSMGIVLGATVPFFAFAADAFSILKTIMSLLNTIVPILITLAVVYFVWGVIQYTLSTDEEAKAGARSKIINGLIGLFIIVSFWGVIALVGGTFGVGFGSGSNSPSGNIVPQTPTFNN